MSGRGPVRNLVLFAWLMASGSVVAQNSLKLDTDRLQFDRVVFDGRIATEDGNHDEVSAYCDILQQARQFPTAELIAAGDRFLTVRDLVTPPASRSHQFQLITLDLRLKVARPMPAPRQLLEAGVPTLYECWLLSPRTDAPVCVVVSELPAGLEPSLEYAVARPVTVAGYFFKLIHYDSRTPDPTVAGKMQVRRAPLLLGHSFELAAEQPAASVPGGWWGGFVPGVVAVLVLVSAAALGLTWYFRRGDRAVHAELSARRSQNPFSD